MDVWEPIDDGRCEANYKEGVTKVTLSLCSRTKIWVFGVQLFEKSPAAPKDPGFV